MFGFEKIVACSLMLGLVAACGGEGEETGTAGSATETTSAAAAADGDRGALRQRAVAIFGVLPAQAPNPANPVTEAKIELGRALYYDTRFSISQQISCNGCHMLDSFGVDNEPTSPGHQGQRGDLNSPTVYYAAFPVAQFWDGRAADVEEQAQGPVTNPVEMAMPDADYVESVLESIPGYEPMFRAAFPEDAEPVNFVNMARAIAAFERRLTTPSRFDQFQDGDLGALPEEEVQGLSTFLDAGCSTCHVGPAVGRVDLQYVARPELPESGPDMPKPDAS